jgi:outer membrane autotransporter protein
VTDGTSNDWYLRNTVAPLPAAPAPGAPPAQAAPDVPVFAEGTPTLPAPPAAGAAPIALYREAVPVYTEIASVAREIGYLQLDTFHERQGDQSLLTETGAVPAAWGRVWGGHSVISQDGAASPEFDGSVYGVQAGHDLYADSNASGHRNHYGLFAGFTRATGDVEGFALGTPNLDAGHLAINAYTLGGYWTHIGPSGWYTDAVLSGSSLTVDPHANDGTGVTTHGTAVAGSVEGGLPLPVGAVSIEPQAQLVWQHLSINDLNDGASSVTFNHGNTFVARLGARVSGAFEQFGTRWQPWLRFNVLRSFGTDDTTTFGGATALGTQVGQTSAQIGAGVVGKVGRAGSVFLTAGWLTNLGGAHQRTVTGNAGVRWDW